MSVGQPSYLLQKVAPIVLRELEPYITGKVGPLVAEKIGMPIARKVGLPLAKRIGIPIARKTGTLLLNRVGYPLINKVIFKGNPPSLLLPLSPQANNNAGTKTMVTETRIEAKADARGKKRTRAEKKIEKQNKQRQKARRSLFNFGKKLQSFPAESSPLNQVVPAPAASSPNPQAPSTFTQPVVQNPTVQNSHGLFDQNQNYGSSLFNRRRQNYDF